MTQATDTRPKVGDRLIRRPLTSRYAGDVEVIVYKVGRKWANARPEGGGYPDVRFDMDTGYEDAGQYSATHRVLSEERFAELDQRAELIAALKSYGLESPFGRMDSITTDKLRRIVAVLDDAGVSR